MCSCRKNKLKQTTSAKLPILKNVATNQVPSTPTFLPVKLNSNTINPTTVTTKAQVVANTSAKQELLRRLQIIKSQIK